MYSKYSPLAAKLPLPITLHVMQSLRLLAAEGGSCASDAGSSPAAIAGRFLDCEDIQNEGFPPPCKALCFLTEKTSNSW